MNSNRLRRRNRHGVAREEELQAAVSGSAVAGSSLKQSQAVSVAGGSLRLCCLRLRRSLRQSQSQTAVSGSSIAQQGEHGAAGQHRPGPGLGHPQRRRHLRLHTRPRRQAPLPSHNPSLSESSAHFAEYPSHLHFLLNIRVIRTFC